MFTCCRYQFDLDHNMGSNQIRNRRNERKIEEKREKDKVRKRKRRASLGGEEISSQAIRIILNLCNSIYIYRICYLEFVFVI